MYFTLKSLIVGLTSKSSNIGISAIGLYKGLKNATLKLCVTFVFMSICLMKSICYSIIYSSLVFPLSLSLKSLTLKIKRPCYYINFRLALYVYEYLLHVGAQKAAQTFLNEIRWEKNITLGEPPGFLHSWWW